MTNREWVQSLNNEAYFDALGIMDIPCETCPVKVNETECFGQCKNSFCAWLETKRKVDGKTNRQWLDTVSDKKLIKLLSLDYAECEECLGKSYCDYATGCEECIILWLEDEHKSAHIPANAELGERYGTV